MTGRDGFTYIEVMAAIVLLGLVLMPAAAMFTGSLAVIGTAGLETEAKELARQKIETAQAGGVSLASASSDSPLVENMGRFICTTSYSRETVTAAPYALNLWKVEVTVSWRGVRDTQFVTLQTLLTYY